VPIFRDFRIVRSWLPQTAYISGFEDSSFHVVSNFDEDIDPETTTIKGGKIWGHDLSRWHEQDIDYHYYLPYGSRSNRVVSVGWEAHPSGPSVFGINLPRDQVQSWGLTSRDMLVFSIAGPDRDASFDVTLELIDAAGEKSQLPLKQFYALQPSLQSRLTKLSFIEEPTQVLILQTVSVPLNRFLAQNPSLALSKLSEISFVLDKDHAGTVLPDDIGFDSLDRN
jgi:hypothetical protein